MIHETIYGCGCTVIGRAKTRCAEHGSTIVATTASLRHESSYTKGKHHVHLCKRSDFSFDLQPDLVVCDKTGLAYSKIKPKMLEGKRVVFLSLKSLRVLRAALDLCESAIIHTTHPIIIRAAGSPDLIAAMTRNGTGKFYAQKQKAA